MRDRVQLQSNNQPSPNALEDGFSLKTREFRVHGVKIHALEPNEVVALVHQWLQHGESERPHFRYLVSTNINNIVCALESPHYSHVMENADLSLPDGVPLLWLGRMGGYKLPVRCGIEEVMLAVFDLSNHGYDYRHYFYGNSDEVLTALRQRLTKQFPKLNIAGMHSPPFRELTPEEHAAHIDLINRSAPDFLWVSLGCPKQELWLFDNRYRLNAGVGGGAGAVFNFLSGHAPRAPRWIRMAGLEWLLRLAFEPKRLWRRYLVRYPKFVYRFLRPHRR